MSKWKINIDKVKKTRKRFVGCTNYFEGTCKTLYPLPQKGKKSLNQLWKICGCHTIRIMTTRDKTRDLCLDLECTSKKVTINKINFDYFS